MNDNPRPKHQMPGSEAATDEGRDNERDLNTVLVRNRRIVIVTIAVIAPVLYALLINLNALDNPPAWDSAVTVSPAAITIVEMDFDVWEVAQLPSSPEGGPSTHATSIYTIGLAALIALLGPASAFYVAHLFSIALVGALSVATYLLARERATVGISALAAVAVSVVPLVVQQAADVYIDLPLAVIATFACWSACRRWFWWSAGLILLGVAVKTSGVFLMPLLLFAKPVHKPLPRHVAHVAGAGLVAMVPFLLTLLTTHRFSGSGTGNPFTDPTLLRSTMSLLVLTTDIFIILSFYVLVVYGRTRSRRVDRLTEASLIVVLGFFAVHLATMVLSATIVILPRYYISILPAVLVALLPVDPQPVERHSPSYLTAIGFFVVLTMFSVLNVRGDFYPRADDDFYVIAERSTRAQQYLELQMLGTRELMATGLSVLVERQVFFRVQYPEMGYVDEAPEEVIPVFIEPVTGLPDDFAMLIERRLANPLVPFEEEAQDLGYELSYRELRVNRFESQLVVASR